MPFDKQTKMALCYGVLIFVNFVEKWCTDFVSKYSVPVVRMTVRIMGQDLSGKKVWESRSKKLEIPF